MKHVKNYHIDNIFDHEGRILETHAHGKTFYSLEKKYP